MGRAIQLKHVCGIWHFVQLKDKITMLEERSLSMEEQIQLLNDVKSVIKGTVYELVLQKSLSKNPDLLAFTSPNKTVDVRLRHEFAPLVTVEV